MTTPEQTAPSYSPPPAPPPSRALNIARDVFVTVLTQIFLLFATIGVIILAMEVASAIFEDRTRRAYSEGMRGSISIVLVAFPAFLIFAAYSARMKAKGEMQRGDVYLKILAYIALFAIVITSFISLIVALNLYMGGELTATYGARIGMLLIIMGLVFAYYRIELKEAQS